jgi:hypothetical protein
VYRCIEEMELLQVRLLFFIVCYIVVTFLNASSSSWMYCKSNTQNMYDTVNTNSCCAAC